MLNNVTYGVIFAVLSLMSLGAFALNLKAVKRFDLMNMASKAVAVLIAAATLGAAMAFALFSFNNFSYRAPKTDELTKQLQSQIEGVKKQKAKYVQKLTTQQLSQLSTEELYASYSKEGRKAIDNLAKDSTLTKDLFVRNVGVVYTADGLMTRSLKATNGRTVDMMDGQNRIIIFADTTEYSANLISHMITHIRESRQAIDVVLMFPISTGTEIDQFFATYNTKLIGPDLYNIVSQDSLANMPNLNVKFLAVDEYHVQNLPSYLAVDGNAVISNAGVGSLVNSTDTARTWISKAFSSEQRYYDQIVGLEDTDAEAEPADTNTSAGGDTSAEATTEEVDE